MNQIKIDLQRTVGEVNRHIFGGFAEHLGRCIYGGIYEPGSALADSSGYRADVLEAVRRLGFSIIRYPGGNFASGYRWRDGVGPTADRPSRIDLAWHSTEPNTFGTNEFIDFCRVVGAEPYLVVNCGDGDLREARDWVEYCNSTTDSALVKLRQQHGVDAPHNVKYWSLGNEVDGPWQIGYKTPAEYARTATEFGKVMKWVDPSIKLVAAATSFWEEGFVERAQLLLEQAGDLLDYMGLHWYVGNREDDFAAYMATSELIEDRLTAYEGLIHAMRLERGLKRPVYIAVDEWNVWYRTFGNSNTLEEIYNLEDALVVAMHLNAFIRHAHSVKMANIAQIVNVIAPIFNRSDGLVLQTIFYPFELYSRTCGPVALDVYWQGDTFSEGVRLLDVVATLDPAQKQLVLYVINRSKDDSTQAEVILDAGSFSGPAQAQIVNGPDIKAENTFDTPDLVKTHQMSVPAGGKTLTYEFEPHSVTSLICPLE